MRRFLSVKGFLFIFFMGLAAFVTVKVVRVDKCLREMNRANGKAFYTAHIECIFDYNKEWDVKVTPEQTAFVNVITQQPFRYLNKGFQVYAFESQDGEYVIKFFQQHRLQNKGFKEHPVEYLFSSSFRDKTAAKLRHKEELFSSSKIAFEMIPEESGILFVHLNRTEKQLYGIRLVDNMGQSYKIKPDRSSFIVQRKAAYILPTLSSLMKAGDVAGAKARLDQIFNLLLSLANKGIVDGDYALVRNNNIGFIKNRCIYIDTGHITYNKNLDVRKQMEYEFSRRLRPLFDWLSFNYPELAQYYELRRHEILAAIPKKEAHAIAANKP